MSGYAVRAAVLEEMSRKGVSYLMLAARLRWSPDHLAIRLGERGPMTRTEIQDLGRALSLSRELELAACQPARTI